MFTNIGGKIKKLTEIICIIGILSSFIGGMSLITIGLNSYHGEGQVAIGIAVLIVGSLLSWIGSFFAYGFGELIENTTIIAELIAKADAKKDNAE